jgi:hypothetical protein
VFGAMVKSRRREQSIENIAFKQKSRGPLVRLSRNTQR